jgi:thiopurine S-methyltransferase
MDSQYWKEKWETGDTLFHLDRPHEQLVRHFPHVPNGKVMVPLCGKSNDLLWLRAQGHEVVGIELSSVACEAFFRENKISCERVTHGSVVKYESDGITLWCGNYFEVPASAWRGCTSVYDRAALIALPEDLRRKYAHHMIGMWREQAPQGSPIFLITVEYASETMGPPFSVSEDEIRTLYGAAFEIQKLNEQREQSLSQRPPKFTGIEVIERVHRLTRK